MITGIVPSLQMKQTLTYFVTKLQDGTKIVEFHPMKKSFFCLTEIMDDNDNRQINFDWKID